MGGNIPGGNFLGGNFPGGNFPRTAFITPRTFCLQDDFLNNRISLSYVITI